MGDRGRRVNQGARPRMFETVRVTNLSETSPKAAIFEARGNDGGRLPVSRTRKRHEKQKKKAFEKRRKQKKNRSGCLSPTNDTRVKWQRSLRRGKVATLIHRSPELSRFFSLSPPPPFTPGRKNKRQRERKTKNKKPRTTRQTGRTRQQCETRSVNGVAHTAREVF